MKRTSSTILLSILLGLAPAFAQSPPAQKPDPAYPDPTYKAPRTSDGHPSLEGVWTHNFIIFVEAMSPAPLVVPEDMAKTLAERMGGGFAAALDRDLDPEVPALIAASDGLPIVRGERRTRAVVLPADGKLPYTPEARRESARYGNAPYDNPEQRPNWERCVTSLGLPPVHGAGTVSANPRRIVQTPSHVVIHTEYGEEARIIPLADRHGPPTHNPIGDSIARWEGETLVVETIRMLESDRVRAFGNLVVPHDSKVIERFTRLSDRELLYQYTIENPKVYTAPWLAEYSLYRTDQRMFEHACHEGNYSLPNILKAARVAQEQKARAAASPAAPK